MRAWSVTPMATDVQYGRTQVPSPLMAAVLAKREGLLARLIKAGEPLDVQNPYGWTALIAAAAQGEVTMVRRLVEAGADIIIQDKRGWDATRYAHSRNYEEIFSVLAPETQFDEVEYEDDDGQAESEFDVDEGLSSIFSSLVDQDHDGLNQDDDDDDDEGDNPELGEDEIDGELEDDESDIGPALGPETFALFEAIEEDDSDAVKKAIDAGAEVEDRDEEGRTALHVAALAGSPQIISLLVDAGADLSAMTETDEMSALMIAISEGNDPSFDVLLELGADPNQADANGFTPLMVAAQFGQWQMVEALIHRGAKIDAKTLRGSTALSAALTSNNVDVAIVLAEQGADWRAQVNDQIDKSCAEFALTNELTSFLEYCEKHGFDSARARLEIEKKDQEELKRLLASEDADTVSILLADGVGRGASVEKIKALINAGAPVNGRSAKGWTALLAAEYSGRFDVAKLLIENGADVTARTYDGLGVIGAIARGDGVPEPEHLRMLVGHDATVTAEDMPLLLSLIQNAHTINEHIDEVDEEDGLNIVSVAVRVGEDGDLVLGNKESEKYSKALSHEKLIGCINTLVQLGVPVDETFLDEASPDQIRGLTPLCLAAGYSMIEVVSRLLELGANPEKEVEVEIDGRKVSVPVIWRSVHSGDADIVRLLVDAGANPNRLVEIHENIHWYPLMAACRQGQVDVVNVLLEGGAKVDGYESEYPSPLAMLLEKPDAPELEEVPDDVMGGIPFIDRVFERSRLETCATLIKFGADPNGISEGRTMLEIAAIADFAEAVELLCSQGAVIDAQLNSGDTPLLAAIRMGNVASVDALLELKAALEPQGVDGVTPLELAESVENETILRLLRLKAGMTIHN
jgi:ankyrin repeat protein